jgi:FkbM family methyltransferase
MAHGDSEASVSEITARVKARDGRLIPADRLLGRAMITGLRQTLWRTPLRVRRKLLRFASLRAVHDAFYRRFGVHVVPDRRFGFSMEIDVSQFDFRAHFRTPHFERHVVDFLAKQVPPDARAIDIGSFCGYYALLFAVRAGPSGRVVAFEPVAEHRSWIERNVGLNGLTNIAVDPRAVGDHTGSAVLRVRGPATSLVVGGRGHDQSIEVIRLDDFVAAGGIDRVDVVKIDAEGAEIEVLEGMRQVLQESRPIVVVEVNHKEGRDRVEAFFQSVGYETELLGRAAHGMHLVGRPI